MEARSGPGMREVAQERLEQKLGLVVHWLAYLAVNIGLVVAAGSFSGSWWRIAGWGLGLAAHTGYVWAKLSGLQERLVEREIDRAVQR